MKHVILLPTYNERENIEKIISRIFELQPQVWVKIIDDNSPDGTGEIVRTLQKKYERLSMLSRTTKDGLGRAYMAGFREVLKDTDATHVIMMDADMSHDPMYLDQMIRESEWYDLVVGSRYVSDGATVGWELWRRLLSSWGNIYARIVTGVPVHDLTGGFNCIRLSLLSKIDLADIDSSGYAFQIELKYTLYKYRAKIREIPIVFANRTGGESKISNHIISEGVLAPWKMRFKNSKISRTNFETFCPLCESRNSEFFVHKNGFDVYKCGQCHFLFVSPLPAEVSVYDQSYFSGAEKGFGYVDYDTDKEPMIPTFETYLDRIAAAGISNGKLLDVGAATGFFMNLARARGFETTGLEISDFAAAQGRAKGLNVLTGDWAAFPDAHFDVITLFDVLEHMREPRTILDDARRILRPGGLLVVNTPDAESVVARILGPRWHLIVPPEHLHYFSPHNLGAYLEKHAFKVRVSGTIGKRFTFQYIFKTLYKWQKIKLWNTLAHFFSHGKRAKLYIPINLHDNFFMIAERL